MRRWLVLLLVAGAFLAPPTPSHAQPTKAQVDSAVAARDPNLPPSEETAKHVLESSPRHGEYEVVTLPDSTPLRVWTVYPERKDKAGVVLLIHDIYGLSDWIRGTADQVAREGFIAVVPDLISGMGPGGGGTDSVASRDDLVKLIRGLTPEAAKARIDATRAWAVKLPAANGKFGTIGYCWGGTRSFAYAAAEPPPQAAVVFYGSSPDSATLAAVRAPVLGLYGGDDARVNATIEPATKALGKRFESHLFPGAGHGFTRSQSLREGANHQATRKAWPLAMSFLRKHLK